VELESLQENRRSAQGRWLSFRHLSRGRKLAYAAALSLIGLLSFQQYEQFSRQELARGASRVSSIVALPSLEVLQDFEIIRRLDRVPQADDELLAVLQ
jgi:hypothetical protein